MLILKCVPFSLILAVTSLWKSWGLHRIVAVRDAGNFITSINHLTLTACKERCIQTVDCLNIDFCDHHGAVATFCTLYTGQLVATMRTYVDDYCTTYYLSEGKNN